MHYVLMTRVPADPQRAEGLLAEIASVAHPVALVMPHPAPVSQLPALDPERVEWVRTGYSEPWFPLLPESEIARQLEREATALADLGVAPGPLWVTGPWATHLPGSFRRAGVESLVIGAETLDRAMPGVVTHLDAVLPVVPVHDESMLSDAASGHRFEHCLVVEVPAERLGVAAERIELRTDADLTTVTDFLARHRASGRLRPRIDDWEARFAEDPDRFVLHRKLVRLVTRVPDRLGAAAENAVLEAERADGFADQGVDKSHRAIVAARVAIDAERHRGDDWWKVSRLDWDADGSPEVHIEQSDLSLVVAPHRSGGVPTLDCKRPVWAVSAVRGEPGWTLCRFSTDLEGLEADPIELTEIRSTEARGGTVGLELAGELDPGTVRVDAEVHSTVIKLGYRLDAMPAGLIGPELKLALGSRATVRVDGSEWLEVSEPIAVAGHKLRITDGDHQAVLTTLTPCSVFLRPGVDGAGVVLWPHWTTTGNAGHQLTIDLSPPIAVPV